MTEALVTGDWLEAHLDNPDVQVIDARTEYHADGTWNGRPTIDAYVAAHIKGAILVDLTNDLNDSSDLPFARLSSEAFRSVAGGLGIDPSRHVVVYDQGEDAGQPAPSKWATRLWWQLKSEGFQRVSVLERGLMGWRADGRPVGSGVESASPTVVSTAPEPGWFADTPEVFEASGSADVAILDSRERDRYLGTSSMPYRAGHIASAAHLALGETLVGDSAELRPAVELAGVFRERLPEDARVIAYCGGGVSASWNAFALRLAGWNDVAVYDGSMTEWTRTEHPLILGDEAAG